MTTKAPGVRPLTGFPNVQVTATYIITKEGFSSNGPVFSVWANDESNIVGQITPDGTKTEYPLTVNLTNLLTYGDLNTAVFGILGVIFEYQSFGGISTEVRVKVQADGADDEDLTWTTKKPFTVRAFQETFTLSSL